MNSKNKDFPQFFYLFKILNEKYQIKFEGLKITLKSSIIPSSGLGSSASTAVALIGAFNVYFELGLTKEQISLLAYESEKLKHGSPSGIDNTICTFGNVIYFRDKVFHSIKVAKPLELLITYTNIPHDTKRVIEKVKRFKIENSKRSDQIFQNIGMISEKAESYLEKGDIRGTGDLMCQNQNLLAELGVSNKTIEEINTIATKNGASGSKLTGAGLGGCVITLGNREILINLRKVFNKMGYNSFISELEGEGVKIEKFR